MQRQNVVRLVKISIVTRTLAQLKHKTATRLCRPSLLSVHLSLSDPSFNCVKTTSGSCKKSSLLPLPCVQGLCDGFDSFLARVSPSVALACPYQQPRPTIQYVQTSSIVVCLFGRNCGHVWTSSSTGQRCHNGDVAVEERPVDWLSILPGLCLDLPREGGLTVRLLR